MGARTSYEHTDILNDYLARQLRQGSLAIVLGAGASCGFGLPGWEKLVDRMFQRASIAKPHDLRPEMAAEKLLRSVFNNDRMQFASAVRDALYEGVSLAFDDLRKNDLLAAVGALAMASSRGSVAKIVSFNFDDIIKLYLSYFGHDVRVAVTLPDWNRHADVQVLYPHRILPSNFSEYIPRPIIFTQEDYDEIIGNASDEWHEEILGVFRSHTCIFIGLSGNDGNLTSLLKKAHDTHACRGTGEMYWGVRFGLDGDELADMWDARGVFHNVVRTYDEIPQILFDVCQRAARLHHLTKVG